MSHGSFHNLYSFLSLLPENINDLRILDVGFGCGQLMHTVMAYGNRGTFSFKGEPYIMGIDIDHINVEFAKKWMPFYREVYEFDATEIPYPENVIKDIDILVCTEMIEHTTDKDKTLKMIKYLSTRAKLVIFMCPYGNTLSNKVKDIEYNNHNSIWYDEDFKKIGFETKLIKRIYSDGVEYKVISIILDTVNIVKQNNKNITKNILAWKRN